MALAVQRARQHGSPLIRNKLRYSDWMIVRSGGQVCARPWLIIVIQRWVVLHETWIERHACRHRPQPRLQCWLLDPQHIRQDGEDLNFDFWATLTALLLRDGRH